MFSGDVKEHELTTLTNKQIKVIVITSSVCITLLKFNHVQAEVALMSVQFINVERSYSIQMDSPNKPSIGMSVAVAYP